MSTIEEAVFDTVAEHFDFGGDSHRLARALPRAVGATPQRIYLGQMAAEHFASLASAVGRLPRFQAAYSVKTNPRDELLDLARNSEFYAEVIGPSEVAHARRRGFSAERIVYNGPVPVKDLDVAVAFADSAESLECNVERSFALAHGLRLRPDGVASRFGITSDETKRAVEAVRHSKNVEALAISFFARSQDIAGRPFVDVAMNVATRAAQIEHLTQKAVVAFSVGGGCSPAEFNDRLLYDYPQLATVIPRLLRDVRLIFIEPGQELVTPVEVVVSSVLEVRRRSEAREIVIDTGLPAVPQAKDRTHRVFAGAPDWRELGLGRDRILGSICMEDDVVRHDVSLRPEIREGDLIAIADAGAYDSSMAFDFAQGREHPEDP